MLVFRLFRVGKNNQPSYKIVVTDKRNSSKGGRFVEQVGFYNPVTKEKVMKKERIQYWLKQGVQPSPTTHNLFIQEKILEGKKIASHKKSKKPAEAVVAEVKSSAPAQTETVTQPSEASKPVQEVPAAPEASKNE